ncbi:MAG: NUDIX hydrolase [Flavobacteriales bacterium]
MKQNYKLYFSGRQVEFIPEYAECHPADALHMVLPSTGKLDTMLLESAVNSGARKISFRCADVMASWAAFVDQFHFVAAAGGCVVNPKGDILFIHRLERWDLPKGKVEPGEDIVVAAVREVEEECSIHGLDVLGHLIDTWHTYVQDGAQMIKRTSWFEMTYVGNETPKPQQEEGITAVRWASRNEWSDLVRHSFPSVGDVVHVFSEKGNAAR